MLGHGPAGHVHVFFWQARPIKSLPCNWRFANRFFTVLAEFLCRIDFLESKKTMINTTSWGCWKQKLCSRVFWVWGVGESTFSDTSWQVGKPQPKKRWFPTRAFVSVVTVAEIEVGNMLQRFQSQLFKIGQEAPDPAVSPCQPLVQLRFSQCNAPVAYKSPVRSQKHMTWDSSELTKSLTNA